MMKETNQHTDRVEPPHVQSPSSRIHPTGHDNQPPTSEYIVFTATY